VINLFIKGAEIHDQGSESFSSALSGLPGPKVGWLV